MRASNCIFAWVTFHLLAVLVADLQEVTASEPANPTFQVKGRVVDETEQPVSGAEVKSLIFKECPSGITDDDGHFVLELPRKPPQFLSLCATVEDQARQAFFSYRLDGGKELPAEIKLVIRPAREIDVTVVESNGPPVQDAKVIASGIYFYAAEGTSDANGKVVLRVPVDTEIGTISAGKPGAGFDYFRYQSPKAPESDTYRLPRDHALPLTLVLNGCRQRVTVRVINDGGLPMAGVSVRPLYIEKPKKGGNCVMADAKAMTDEHGLVTFDDLPVDCSGPVTFATEAKGYYAPKRAMLEPGSEAAEITATLSRLLPVHGQVTFYDGRPGAGVKVSVAGDGYVGERFHDHTQADEHGHFELGVYPNQFYVFAAAFDDSITPLVTRLIRDEDPTDQLRLVLRKATHVHGRLTIGPDRRPYAGQFLILQRHGEDEYGKVPKSDRLPELDTHRINPMVTSSTFTDSQGEFEFLGGPGKCCLLRFPGMQGEHFELTNEAEFEINLHADRPDEEEFAGRVISQDEPPRGIAEAQVAGFALKGPAGMRSTSGAEGSFRATRRTVAMLIYARTEDGSMAGIVRVGPDDRSMDIPVASAASARGRLIDPTTGAPLGNVELTYGVSWDGPRSGLQCGGKIRSNDQGEFTADGLVPGWQYQFVAIRAKVPASRPTGGHWVQLTRITPDWAENIDLGDFKVDLSEVPRPVRAAVRVRAPRQAKIYDTEADGNEQIAAALKTATDEQKRVLLQFGADWCVWCHKLNDCFKENDEIAAALRENYILVPIEVNLLGERKHNADVNERYGNPTRHGLPVLVVLDADGNVLKTKDTGELNVDDDYGPKKVLAFLNRWKPE